jgi:hypothetical protein
MSLKVNTVVEVNSLTQYFIGTIVEVKRGFGASDTYDRPLYVVKNIDTGKISSIASCYVTEFTKEHYIEYKKIKIDTLNRHLNNIAERL